MTTPRPVPTDSHRILEAAQQLARSEKGRNALTVLQAWFDADGCALDASNQACVRTLLDGAWGSLPGTTREFIHEALEQIPY